MKKRLFLNSSGVRLDLLLELPEGEGPFPLLLLVHGVTGNKLERHLEGIAGTALQAGFAVLRADLYGHGESGGRFEDHTVGIWKRNLLDLLDYAAALPFVSGIWLSGHSQGGLAVMLAAAERPDLVRGLIPLSPAWMIPEKARQGSVLGHDFDPADPPAALPIKEGFTLGRDYLLCAQTTDPEAAMDAYPGPVLIVQGTADASVPWGWASRAAERYRHAELALIHGDTHCYDRHLDEVEEFVGAWLRRQKP